jgi:hypothetical protein
MMLLGIAEQTENGQRVRIAMVNGGGELWLVREGDVVSGRYRVGRIAADAVQVEDNLDGTSRTYRLR